MLALSNKFTISQQSADRTVNKLKINRRYQGRQVQAQSPTAVRSLAKLGVPRPVTGSQPAPAGKPLVLQPGFEPKERLTISSILVTR